MKLTGRMRTIIYVPTLILIAASFCVTSCDNNNMYKKYKNYSKGFEDAQKGESQPSFYASKDEKEGYDSGLNDLRSGNSKSPTIDFQYKEEEIKSMENKWTTFEEMLADAIGGNRDAMFAVGLCYLCGGKGLPVDVSTADMFFSKAASLGHAPALEKIRGMYWERLNEDMSNGFLHQVYLNLVIAMGHTEYTMQYHKVRTELIEKLGKNGKLLTDEIERIAGKKLDTIYKNLENMKLSKKSKNSDAFFLQLNDITLEDSLYDSSYWLSVAGIEEGK